MKKRVSDYLAWAMLSIFGGLLAAAVLLAVFGDLSHLSYPVELFAALFLLFLLSRAPLRTRWEGLVRRAERCRPITAGACLAALCFLLNLLWVLYCRVEPTVDYYTNYVTACHLAEGNWRELDYLYLGLFPHIFGYGWLMSFVLRAFGRSPMVIAVFNVALTTVSGLLIYGICLQKLSRGAAAAAFLLWAVCPSKLLYNAMVLPEPVYTCLLLLFFFLFLQAERLERTRGRRGVCLTALAGLAAGAVLCLVNILRPLAAIVMIALAVWIVALRGEALRRLQSWMRWGVFCACLVLSFYPLNQRWTGFEAWMLRTELADVPAYSIYVGLDTENGGSFSEEAMERLMNYRYDEENGSAKWAQEQMMNDTVQRLRDGGLSIPRLLRVKLPKLLGSDEGGSFYAEESLSRLGYVLSSVLSNVYYYVLVVLTLAGAAALGKRRGDGLLILPLYAAGLILAHMIVEVAGRYKYCLIPLFVILGACALTSVRETGRNGGNRAAEAE